MSARVRALSVGGLAAVVAIAVAELAAGLVAGWPSLLDAVGGVVIDIAPPTLKDSAITVFGTADKPALLIGTVIVAAMLGAALGLAPRTLAITGFGVFAAAGVAAAGASTGGSAGALAVGLAAFAAGVAVLTWLPRPLLEPAPDSTARRQFFRHAGGLGAGALVAGLGGRALQREQSFAAARDVVTLPRPSRPLQSPPPGADLPVRGLSPLFTPNDRFYRIDTALTVPRVDPASWRLRATGLVAQPREWTLDELLDMPMVEADVTIACVSNEVGGDLVGSARWLGVPLSRLLDEAAPEASAAQIVGRSVDGFTAGFPIEAAYDGREALVVVGMNGEPLPAKHGFPARLVVAGLYGYVSATKWLADIELAPWDFDGYWVPRGWAKEAPVKTQSRIDVPRQGARITAGPAAVAGVAWAPTRGIVAVEVQVDDGPWRAATLSAPLGDALWRQWQLDWDATPGRHQITVRATDGEGLTQTERRQPPRPDGATGWHTVTVEVREAQ